MTNFDSISKNTIFCDRPALHYMELYSQSYKTKDNGVVVDVGFEASIRSTSSLFIVCVVVVSFVGQ